MGKKFIAVSVTTWEALLLCIQDKIRVIAVENPLYSQIHEKLDRMAEVTEYAREEYPDKETVLLKKVHGENRFDDSEYEILYLPLQWEGWKS